jgi:NADPH:quinone reductase-like Zn-dependent oxidoreductase
MLVSDREFGEAPPERGTAGARGMKAYLCRRYGGPEVVELADVVKPAPGAKDLLIRIHATTVTAGDWRVRTLVLPTGFGALGRLVCGFTRPRQPVLGTELAGVVEAVGQAVTRFRPGDAVMAFPGSKMGCHAEYRLVPEDGPVALKPGNLSFEEAASLSFGASTALHFLRKARAGPGEQVLVVGASGGVGTALVQIARHMGCVVTGVTSTANLDLVRGLGADRVIDYTREDFAGRGEAYDIIADTVGATSFARSKGALRDRGRLLAVAAGLPDMLTALWAPLTRGCRVIAGPAAERPEVVRQIAGLAEAGVLRPVIDRCYAFSQMAEAHAYVGMWRKRGSFVVRVLPEPA